MMLDVLSAVIGLVIVIAVLRELRWGSEKVQPRKIIHVPTFDSTPRTWKDAATPQEMIIGYVDEQPANGTGRRVIEDDGTVHWQVTGRVWSLDGGGTFTEWECDK